MLLFILLAFGLFVLLALVIRIVALNKRVEDLEVVADDSVRKDHLAVLIRNHISGMLTEHETEEKA